MATARAILERGDGVLIFPEGTRIRPGALGTPKRGVGRLALETGAPVVPVAMIGTEDVRRGWRIRPHKVRIRAGAPLTFPSVAGAPPPAGRRGDRAHLAVRRAAVGVAGRPAPIRRAAVIGAGAWGTGLAVALARAGLEVDLGTRAAEQPASARVTVCPTAIAGAPRRRRRARPPRPRLPRRPARASCPPSSPRTARASPARRRARARQGPGRAARHAALRLRRRAHARPRRRLPRRPRPRRRRARAGAVARRRLRRAAAFLAQLADVLRAARFEVERTTDVTGVELAGAASNAAVLAAAAAAPAGPNAAGAAAGKVFAEVDAYARSAAATPRRSPASPATGDLPAPRRSTRCRCSPSRCARRRRRPGRRRAGRRRRGPRRPRALGRGRDAAHPRRGRGARPE